MRKILETNPWSQKKKLTIPKETIWKGSKTLFQETKICFKGVEFFS
jgi:hypothetical protein